MVEKILLEAAFPAPDGDDCSTSGSAGSAPEFATLATLAEIVGANPNDVAGLESELRTGLSETSAEFKASGPLWLLPLSTELEQTLDALAGNLGLNGCTALAAGIGLLTQGVTTATSSRAQQMVAIAELRSARHALPPWRNPLIERPAETPENEKTSAETRRDLISRALATFRKSLLKLLKAESIDEAGRLAEVSAQVALACGDRSEQRRWCAAGEFFSAASESGEAGRPLVKGLAVKLEQVLRSLSDGTSTIEQSRADMIEDLEVLAALLRPVDAGTAGGVGEFSFKLNRPAFESALEQLSAPTAGASELLLQVADAFLAVADEVRWLEARELAFEPENVDLLRAAAARWWATASNETGGPSEPEANNHFDDARAALTRIEGALQPRGGSAGDGKMRISGIPVDQVLLENLNMMASGIRGARSRAEANLGSLRGGLVDMERTIRRLRSQLESLEVDSQAQFTAASEPGSKNSAGARFGALSRGIEELAGLKDALQALTEETESVLAVQAGEDTQLEQGLLKTRMMPVGDRFEALCQCVQRTAAGWGVAAALSARGAEVILERSQVDALYRVLEPLLEACVRDGLTASASPARRDPAVGRLELEVSQPRFDVCVEILYRGAPLSQAVLSDLAPALNVLGAVAASSLEDGDRARVRLLIPGPPQPMELLLVEADNARFALPLKDVSGVSRLLRTDTSIEGGDGCMSFEGQPYRLASLAQALDPEADCAEGNACVLVARGATRLAFRVKSVIGRKRMMVRSPGPLLSSNSWVLGAVIDPLAAPTLVLDLSALESLQVSEPA